MRIVLGYDGSEDSKRALERATAFAASDTEFVVVSAAEPRGADFPRSAERVGTLADGPHLDPALEEARQATSDAEAQLAQKGFEAQSIEAYGDPGNAIIEAAEGADLVVVGSRGLNRLERVLLGSVSTKVVQRAPCDVLVVR